LKKQGANLPYRPIPVFIDSHENARVALTTPPNVSARR